MITNLFRTVICRNGKPEDVAGDSWDELSCEESDGKAANDVESGPLRHPNETSSVGSNRVGGNRGTRSVLGKVTENAFRYFSPRGFTVGRTACSK